MSVEKPEENSMNGVEETTPLSDVRRSRTRSTGRPPSQHFLKESALQRTVSIECEDLPSHQRHESLSDSNDSILDEVLEITQKKIEDKEAAEATRKMNLIIQPKHIVKEEIPWMKEFLKKKERQRSLLEDEKKTIEEFVKNDELSRKVKGTTYEFTKRTSFSNFDKERNTPKNEDGGKNQKPLGVRKKSDDATTIDENIVTRSRMVVSETNSEKYSSIAETHQVATTTESSSIQSISKRLSHSKKPIELPRVELTKSDSSKIETIKAGLNISNVTKVDSPIPAPKLPIPSLDIEDQTDKSEKVHEKKSSKIQIQELLLKIKNFEETTNKRLKNIRNELKVLHREVSSQSDYVTEFVKTLENDLAAINNAN